MKLSEIKQALVDLNDGENIEYETSFVTAANLALGHISRIVPEERTTAIDVVAPSVGVVGKVNTAAVYNGRGVRSISLRAMGEGKLMSGDRKLAAWQTKGVIRNVCVRLDEAEDIELHFADIRGGVYDLALWDIDFGTAENVPLYGALVRYDMRVYAPDLDGAMCPPTDARTGRRIAGCSIESPYILIPATFSGIASVTYRHRLRRINLDDVGNDADIDIAPEYEDLLPLCMAYYVWLEDEPNKAAFFLARFNEMAALARQTYKRSGSSTVISYNGW